MSLALRGIAKAFAGVAALSDISLDIPMGRVLGVLGENGAGKSTLMNILYGLVRPDAGTITIQNRLVHIRSPRDALEHGIGMVHQHFALIPTMSVVDNLVLALGRGLGRAHRRACWDRIATHAERFAWRLDPDVLVGALSLGDQQRLEILKALAGGGQCLILDEPTAVLTPQEVDHLLKVLRDVADDGRAVVMITHKLHEVTRLCDDVAILRRGRLVHAGPARDLDEQAMAAWMIGSPPERRSANPPADLGQPMLTLRSASLRRPGGADEVSAADVTVRAGEVVGVAGVDGNGQIGLVGLATGLRLPDLGTVERVAGSPAYIPDDRLRDGLITGLSVRDNLLLRARGRPPYRRMGGWLDLARWTTRAKAMVQTNDIRTASIHLPAGRLSGGNQQKVVVARELADGPRLIVAHNPTRGLDLAASQAVLDALVASSRAGAGVLLVHSDLDELLSVADRILVLHSGRITDSGFPAASRSDIGRLMMGLGKDGES